MISPMRCAFLGQAVDRLRGLFGGARRLENDAARAHHLLLDLPDRSREFFRRACDHAHVARGFGRRIGGGTGALRAFRRRRRQAVGSAGHFFAIGGHLLEHLADRRAKFRDQHFHTRPALLRGAAGDFNNFLQGQPLAEPILEALHRFRHRADFVVTIERGNLNVQIAEAKTMHCGRHLLDGQGDAQKHEVQHSGEAASEQ